MNLYFYAYRTTDDPSIITMDFIVDDTPDGAIGQLIATGVDMTTLPGLQIAGGMQEPGPARIIAGIPIGDYAGLLVR